MLVMPWMGLATSTFAVDVVRFVRERKRPAVAPEAPVSRAEKRRREKAARQRRAGQSNPQLDSNWKAWPLVTAGIALVATLAYRQGIGHDRQTEMGEEGSHYSWHDSRFLPSWANGVVKATFWSDVSDPIHPPNAIT